MTQAEWQQEVETLIANHQPWTVISAWCSTTTGMYCAALALGGSTRSCVLTLPAGPTINVGARAAEIARQLKLA